MENNLEFGNYSAMEDLSAELFKEKKKVSLLQYVVIGLGALAFGFAVLYLINNMQYNDRKDSKEYASILWN